MSKEFFSCIVKDIENFFFIIFLVTKQCIYQVGSIDISSIIQ